MTNKKISKKIYNVVSELEKDIFTDISLIFTKDKKASEYTKIYLIGRALARIQSDNIDMINCLRMLISAFIDETVYMQEDLTNEKERLNQSVNKFLNAIDTKTNYKIN